MKGTKGWAILLVLTLLLGLAGCRQPPEEEAAPAPLVENTETGLPPAPEPQPRPTDHTHQPAEVFYSTGRYIRENQAPVTGKLTVNGESYRDKNAFPALNRLLPLAYDPAAVCGCGAEYIYETEYGRFEINLTESFARCAEGQAALTAAQSIALGQIFTTGTTTQGYGDPVYTGAIPLPSKPSTVTGHTHGPAAAINYAETPAQGGECGNKEIVLTVDGFNYYMTGLYDAFYHLRELNYDQLRCGCPAEFRIEGENHEYYEINLTEAFARTDRGQTDLTQAQIDYFRALFARLETAPPIKPQ